MSAKRPVIDLMSLTSDQATVMPEAVQRVPSAAPALSKKPRLVEKTATADLQPLAFKVPPAFRRRFRQRAAALDLKLNELLFAAFEAFEAKQGEKKNS